MLNETFFALTTALYCVQSALLAHAVPLGAAPHVPPSPRGEGGVGRGGGAGERADKKVGESWTENPENNDDSGDAASWCHECHLYYGSSKTYTSELKSSDLQRARLKGGTRWGDIDGRHGAPCQREPD